AGLAVLVGLVTATWLRSAAPELSPDQFAWPMAACLLCAPAVFPWYLLWLLPFLTSASTLLIILWTVSIIPVYVNWHLRTLGRPWGSLPGWVMLLEYGCRAIAAGIRMHVNSCGNDLVVPWEATRARWRPIRIKSIVSLRHTRQRPFNLKRGLR